MSGFDWETWLIETGDQIIQKKAFGGLESLSSIEQLTYCLWVADYGMRNAGDLQTARDLYPNFQAEAAAIANELNFTHVAEAFALSLGDLESSYFSRFTDMCHEISNGLGPIEPGPNDASGG